MSASLVEKRQTIRRNRIFTVIKENDAVFSRNDICKLTRYSMTTVASIVDNCIADGFLVEKESNDSRVGRRPVLLSINPGCIYFAGIECSSWSVNLAVIDASAKLFYQDTIPLHKPWSMDILKAMDEILQKFQQSFPEEWSKTPSLVVSMAGELDAENGIGLSYASVKDWKNIDAKSHFQYLGKQLYFMNNADSMLLGYCAQKKVGPEETVLFVLIRNGTGVRIYSKGTLLSKYHVLCEFGHMKAENSNRLCSCGKRGCYDAEITTIAILNKIEEAFSTNRLGVLWERCGNHTASLTLDAFLTCVEEGDPDAQEIFVDVSRYIARLLSQIYLLCTPDRVVLCTELCRVQPLFLSIVESASDGRLPKGAVKEMNIDYVLPLKEFASFGSALSGYNRYFDVSTDDD